MSGQCMGTPSLARVLKYWILAPLHILLYRLVIVIQCMCALTPSHGSICNGANRTYRCKKIAEQLIHNGFKSVNFLQKAFTLRIDLTYIQINKNKATETICLDQDDTFGCMYSFALDVQQK